MKSIVASPQGRSKPPPSASIGPDDQRLGQVHHRVVVAVGLVGLEHRELGVVLRADPLVAEDPADLEDPLHAADQQPLQVQLEGDPQEEVDVERVVVRDERPGRRAAGDRLHRRRLDLDEPALGQDPAERRDDLRAAQERRPSTRGC